MPIAIAYPSAHDSAARTVEVCLARFSTVDLFTIAPGETVADLFADTLSSNQVVFLIAPGVVPGAKREAWAGLLEHIEGRKDPPFAFYFLEPCDVPAAVRRAPCFEDLRSLAVWIAGFYQLPGIDLAPLPWFTGRTVELDLLWSHLVDQAGALALTGPALCGKSALAQHFALAASTHFQKTEWIAHGRQIPTSAISERTLVIVDDAPPDLAVPPGNSSVLITAREWSGCPTLTLDPVPLPALPADPRLAQLALLNRNAFHRLAAGLPLPELQSLVDSRALDPVDANADWFRLPWPIAPDESHRGALAREVHRGILIPHERHSWLPEALPAFDWCCRHNWPLAIELGRRAANALEQSGWRPEAAHLWHLLEDQARLHGNRDLAAEAASARAWIVNDHTGAYRTITPGDQLDLFS